MSDTLGGLFLTHTVYGMYRYALYPLLCVICHWLIGR